MRLASLAAAIAGVSRPAGQAILKEQVLDRDGAYVYAYCGSCSEFAVVPRKRGA
jgi:hypothetical protein